MNYTKGKEIIKQFEGLRLTAYRCPAGVLTIGWGHTAGVHEGEKISEAQAEAYLDEDIKKIIESNTFTEVVKHYALNDNQASALLSFTFNCGLGNLTKLTANNTRDIQTVGDKLLLYTKANGKTLAGLVSRRAKENALFFTPVKTAPVVARVVVTTYDAEGRKINEIEL